MILEQTKREIKKQETLKKLEDAMNLIMNEYDFNTVTIRNICKVSGVSSGSFYNLFNSKEQFLTYCLTKGFVDYKNEYYKDNKEFSDLSPIEKTIDIFVCCARYNVDKGVKYISGFYSPYNHDLSPINHDDKLFSFTPLCNEAKEYLSDTNLRIDNILNDFCFIFNGCTFNWCISDGQIDIVSEVRKQLKTYIKYIKD